MPEELSSQKKQQMEAIKLVCDWSKWLIGVETAGIGGIVALIGVKSPTQQTHWFYVVAILLVSAGLSFLFSIYSACLAIFSLPEIVQQLPSSDEEDVFLMKDPYFPLQVIDYLRRQYKGFVYGLACVSLALAVWATWGCLLPLIKP
jgi:hypothetical protein